MGIGKELGESLARIRKGLEETKAGTGEIIDLTKKGATEASNRALDKTSESATRVKEALAEARTKAEKETGETKASAMDCLDKAGQAVATAQKELTGAADKIKAKSVGGTEDAITKAKKVLDEAEDLITKIK